MVKDQDSQRFNQQIKMKEGQGSSESIQMIKKMSYKEMPLKPQTQN